MSAGRLDDFLAFSSALTGFEVFHLRGTGQAEAYLATVEDIVGHEIAAALLDAFGDVARHAGEDTAALERGLRLQILSDDRLGPVARALLKLWYVGTWYELPAQWREAYGGSGQDRTFVVSADAYTEGLLWPAVGANPSGAKPLGYGTWATPPRIDGP